MIKTIGFHAITFKELLILIKFFFENEDKLYPIKDGFNGRNMLFEAIKLIKNNFTVEEALKKCELLDKISEYKEQLNLNGKKAIT